MKKIIVLLFILTIPVLSQNRNWWIHDTTGTVPKRITAYETINPLTNVQWLTITGNATGSIIFSFGDSLFAAKSSKQWGANDPILHYSIWIPQRINVWYKSVSGTIDINLEFYVK